MNSLEEQGFDARLYWLGSLCKNGHAWNERGLTLRYIKGGGCVQCRRETMKAWQKRHPKRVDGKTEKGIVGSSGSYSHRQIVDLIRCETLSLLEANEWKDTTCLTISLLRGKSKLIPDVTFIHTPSAKTVLVEVGRYQPCKWDSSLSVIHIGFNRRVSTVNFGGCKFESALYKTILGLVQGKTATFQNRIDLVWDNKPLKSHKEIRDSAIFALLKSGLSVEEISQLQITDYDRESSILRVKSIEVANFRLTLDATIALHQWIEVRMDINCDESSSLFIAMDRCSYGKPLSREGMAFVLRKPIRNLLS